MNPNNLKVSETSNNRLTRKKPTCFPSETEHYMVLVPMLGTLPYGLSVLHRVQ